MSESTCGHSLSSSEENYSERRNKTYKTGYVVVIYDDEGHLCDTPFASFNKGLAEEVALEYAWEMMWREWYFQVHGTYNLRNGYVSAVYVNKLTDYHVQVKEIPWYG